MSIPLKFKSCHSSHRSNSEDPAHPDSNRTNPTTITKAKRCISGIVDVLIPDRCCLCYSLSDKGYCSLCQLYLPWIYHGCKQCGTTLASGFTCGSCQQQKSYWNEAIIPFQYTDPIASQIHALKYQAKLSVASALARILASTVIKRSRGLPDMIIPVPLHSHGLKRRGYNQSALIASEMGNILGIPMTEEVVVKSRYTESQTKLDQDARRSNIHGAFDVIKSSKGGSIAIVDDVITSGATVTEVCKTLRGSGYDQISVWAVAKTPIVQ